MPKAIFFDRDGVLNVDRGQYTYRLEDFHIMPGVKQVLTTLKRLGFRLIVVTNQAGISKGIYGYAEMNACHAYLQEQTGHNIDHFYHAPDHPDFSESLSRKPGSLLFEKAVARFELDPGLSWMIGDQERDLIPAEKLGMKTIAMGKIQSAVVDYTVNSLSEIVPIIASEG